MGSKSADLPFESAPASALLLDSLPEPLTAHQIFADYWWHPSDGFGLMRFIMNFLSRWLKQSARVVAL